jgi:hypothetical protein
MHPLQSTLRFIFFIISGVGLSPLGTAATSDLLYKPQMIDEGDCGSIGGIKRKKKTSPSATLSTKNPTWADPGSNPGCRGGKPVTNRLSYGAAHLGLNEMWYENFDVNLIWFMSVH